MNAMFRNTEGLVNPADHVPQSSGFHNSFTTTWSASSASTAHRSNTSAATPPPISVKKKVRFPFRSPLRRKRPMKVNWHSDIKSAVSKRNFQKLERNAIALQEYFDLYEPRRLEKSCGSLSGRLIKKNNCEDKTGLLQLDEEKRTPLHVLLSLQDDNLEELILNILHLEPKAASMATTKQRYCLHYAVVHRHEWSVVGEIVDAFPEALSKLDCKGSTPLQYAMQMAIRESARSPPPRTYWMLIGTDDESIDSLADGALLWQDEQAQRWAVVHWLLLSSAIHPQSSLDVGNNRKPMLVDALVHAAPPAVISLLIGASVTLLSYAHKISAFAASSLYTCITRHYPATILMSLANQLVLLYHGSGSIDVHKVRDETGMGLVAAQYISGCYMQESAGEWSLSEEVYMVLLECIKAGDIVDEDPALVDWWKKVEFLVAFCRKVKRDDERSNPADIAREYLLHAALTNSDTPPFIVRMLLALYSESIQLQDPWDGALPLHLACMTQDYIPRYYENFALATARHFERTLDVVLEADVSAVKKRFDDRLPLHHAIAAGKVIDSLESLLNAGAIHNSDGSLDYIQLSQRDPKTHLFPFQLAATYSNKSDHDTFRWTCVARNKFSYAVWQGKSDRQKASSVLQVASAEETRRIDTVYQLLRLRPGVLAKVRHTDPVVVLRTLNADKGDAIDENDLMNVFGISRIAAKYIAWNYSITINKETGKHYVDINLENQNLLQLASRYFSTTGSCSGMSPAFEDWWMEMRQNILKCNPKIPDVLSGLFPGANLKIPKQDEYLLHIALADPDTPPEVIELLLKENPRACSKSLHAAPVLPLHIAAAVSPYRPQSWESGKKTRLGLVLQAYPQAVRAAIKGFLPLHFAILTRKSCGQIESLIREDFRAVSVRDPHSGLLPFQLMACQCNFTSGDALEFNRSAHVDRSPAERAALLPNQRAQEAGLARFHRDIDGLSSVFLLLRRTQNLSRIFGSEAQRSKTEFAIAGGRAELERRDVFYSDNAVDASSKSDDSLFVKKSKEAKKVPPRRLGSASLNLMLSQHRSKHTATSKELYECDASVLSNIDVMSSLTTTIHTYDKIPGNKESEESDNHSINIYSFASDEEDGFSETSSGDTSNSGYADFAEDSALRNDYHTVSGSTSVDAETTDSSTENEDELERFHDSLILFEIRRKPRRGSERMRNDELAPSQVKFSKKSPIPVMDGIGVHSLSSRASKNLLASSSDKSLSSTHTDRVSIPSTYSYRSLRSDFREKLNSSKSMLWMSPEVLKPEEKCTNTNKSVHTSIKSELRRHVEAETASAVKRDGDAQIEQDVLSPESAALLGDLSQSSTADDEIFSSLSPARAESSTNSKLLDVRRRSSLLVAFDDSEHSEETVHILGELSASKSIEACSHDSSKSRAERKSRHSGLTLWDKITVTMSIPEGTEESDSQVHLSDENEAKTMRTTRSEGHSYSLTNAQRKEDTVCAKYFDKASMTWKNRENSRTQEKTSNAKPTSSTMTPGKATMIFDKTSMMWKPKDTGPQENPANIDKKPNGLTRNYQRKLMVASPFVSLPPEHRPCVRRGSVRRPEGIQRRVQRSLSSFASRTACVSCKQRDREVLLVPCRHLCLCRQCSSTYSNVSTCPLCSESVTDRMVIFLK